MQQLGSTESPHASLINIYKRISAIPPEVLRLIFTFLGSGYFRFIGVNSCIFHELYLIMIIGADRTTAVKNVVSSVSCVEQYLKEAGRGMTQVRVILNGAASYGQLEISEWAHQHRYSHAYSEVTSTSAVEHGQLAALIWLKDHGCRLTSAARNNAARHGHLIFLQWLRTYGCPWDEDTCSDTARGGLHNILQWARANGCPWHVYTCLCAAEGGHHNIISTILSPVIPPAAIAKFR